ncbi:MAG: hypothetical protein QM499_11040 [Flavobacteriaceae bacterium]
MTRRLPFWMKVLWIIAFPGLFIIVALGVYKFFYPTSQLLVDFNGFNVHQNPLSFLYLTISSLSILIWAINYTFSFILAKLHQEKIKWTLPYIMTLLAILIGVIFNYL